MELRQLRCFLAVARHLSFTRAAEELHLAQPALSQHVRRLEAELGLELFARTTRRVRLTEAGELFLLRAQRALAELESGEQELAALSGIERGRIAIGAMASLSAADLSGLLARFHARYPGVELTVREEPARAALALIERDELDVAILPLVASIGPAIAATPLYTEELVIVGAVGSLVDGHARIALDALRDQGFVLSKPGSSLRDVAERAAAAEGFVPRLACETNDPLRVRALVARGLGVGLLPRSVATHEGPPVAVASVAPRPLLRTVSLAWRAARRQSAAAAAFLDVAHEHWSAAARSSLADILSDTPSI